MAKHIPVVYFSRSGNTRKIANLIQQEVGGMLHEIQVEVPVLGRNLYPSARNQLRRAFGDTCQP